MARTLIAGCGYVGSALAQRLLARGQRVWGLRRSAAPLPEGVTCIRADLADAGSLPELPPDLDCVVYAAGPGGREDADYRRAYPEGLGGLLTALEAQGQRPRRTFFVSSTSVYAQDRGERVDESSPAEPRRFNGRRLLEAEALLRASRFAGTVVRFAGIYGPGRTRLLESVRGGQAPAAEGPPRYTNRIHRDDCAGMLDHLIGLAHAEPLYLGVDCEPVAEDRLRAWLAGALRVPAPPPGRADVDGFRGKRCDNARLLACGYAFRYPSYRDGYTALIRAER